jgi:hypothetical protein
MKLQVTALREHEKGQGEPPKQVKLYLEESLMGTKVLANVNGTILNLVFFRNTGEVQAYEYCDYTGFDTDSGGRILFSHLKKK